MFVSASQKNPSRHIRLQEDAAVMVILFEVVGGANNKNDKLIIAKILVI